MDKLIYTFQELKPENTSLAGGKGGSLARMFQAGFPVPDGFVLPPCGFSGDSMLPEAWKQVKTYLEQLRLKQPGVAFAVRSSALSEDSPQASFAGEFESVLNVRSDEEIQAAIQAVHQSRKNERVQAYSQAKGLSAAHEIAVVVQQLVEAESSGILFTANPVTGQRDQAVINAAWGLGEAVVGGLVTPDTLIMDTSSGKVLSRETAEKFVMTVRMEHNTGEQPVPENLRHAAVLSDIQAVELAGIGERIEALYGMPMDIEWVYSAEKFYIVQARPITALPVPEPPPPSQWKLNIRGGKAMRNNIVELMAEPLTPLFGTWGRAAINASMNRLLANFGLGGVLPAEAIITVNEYAYYNGSIKASGIFKLLFNMRSILKRMFTGAVERWTEIGRPRYLQSVASWQTQDWRSLSSVELLDAARQQVEAALDAFGALFAGAIPAAWITEALFTVAYKMLIKRPIDPPAPTFLLGFDSLPIRAEKALYDLAAWARLYPSLAAYLKDTPTTPLARRLLEGQPPTDVDADLWAEWQSRFQAYLQQFGHTIYNLDFSNPTPADDPAPLLETLKLFLSGQGTDPYARQQAASLRRTAATHTQLNRLTGFRLKIFRRLLDTAQRYAPLREDGLADLGLAYPLLRKMLRELGSRFVQAGLIAEGDDIFWLEKEEVEQAAAKLDRGERLESLAECIPQRKAVIRAARRVKPPIMLPRIPLLEKTMSKRSTPRKGNTLKGVGASPGKVTATACVLRSFDDFPKMLTGNVLVASITTPAWTPLFARASAIVTDIGGPLSHGSIVAREYGIPAVLGTGSATAAIHTGQMVTVDGDTGIITIHEIS